MCCFYEGKFFIFQCNGELKNFTTHVLAQLLTTVLHVYYELQSCCIDGVLFCLLQKQIVIFLTQILLSNSKALRRIEAIKELTYK